MSITRRELLGRSGSWLVTAALADLFPSLALASPAPSTAGADHFFVLLRTDGGMDVTLGLDPQVMPAGCDAQDIFIEYRPDEIIQAAGLKLGPAAKPLVPHAADCLVLNGVMMRRDAGHPVCNLYMATGRGDGKAAALPVELALATSTGPFGVVVNATAYVAGKPASLSAVADLVAEMNEGSLVELIEERLKLLAAGKGTPFEEAEKQIVAGKSVAANLVAMLKKMATENEKLDDNHVLAAAFATGAARQAQLDLRSPVNLDTHQNHEGIHLRGQTAIWQQAADLFALFKKIPHGGGSLFDATTFFAMSEFSRTPALNAGRGKDHNPFTNSVLLAGKGVRGGTVVGASRIIPRGKTGTGMPDHIAWPFDYDHAKLAQGPQNASFFFPENVVRTIAHLFGDPPTFAAVPKSTRVIPGLLRDLT